MKKADYTPDHKGPLDGVRVVDLTRLAAGNMLTHMLADFGAEVIKIERPGVGDDLRRFGKKEIWWKEYARSKKSLTLDIKEPEGKDILIKLLATADVMVENFVPGTLEKWGIGPEQLKARFPDLILVRLSGWGQDGPFKGKPGFGSLIEGFSGLAAMSGFEDRPPLLPPLALADMISGITGYGSVVTALLARQTGQARGQVIDLTLYEPLFNVLGPWVLNYAVNGSVPKREGNQSEIAAPRNIYETADGKYLALSASMQSMWEKLALAMGRADLIDEPKYATNMDRVAHASDLDPIVADFIKARTREENLALFEPAGVTVGPILDPSELIHHPYMLDREVIREYPDDDLGDIPLHTVFPRLSETPGAVKSPAPGLGEHSEVLLAELGLNQSAISALKKRKII